MLSTTTVSKDITPQNIEYIKSFKDIQVKTWFKLYDTENILYFKLTEDKCLLLSHNTVNVYESNYLFPDRMQFALEQVYKVSVNWQ